jgi:hypothetical protein
VVVVPTNFEEALDVVYLLIGRIANHKKPAKQLIEESPRMVTGTPMHIIYTQQYIDTYSRYARIILYRTFVTYDDFPAYTILRDIFFAVLDGESTLSSIYFAC